TRSALATRKIVSFGLTMAIAMMLPLLTVDTTQAQLSSSVSALAGNDLALNARIAARGGGTRLLLHNPLLGVGPAGFGYGVWDYLNPQQAEPMIRDPLGERFPAGGLEEGGYAITGDVISFADATGVLVVTRLGWDKA